MSSTGVDSLDRSIDKAKRMADIESGFGTGDCRVAYRVLRAWLEAADQPFLFFADSQTGRGNLMYHRYDGHYGLIGPAD